MDIKKHVEMSVALLLIAALPPVFSAAIDRRIPFQPCSHPFPAYNLFSPILRDSVPRPPLYDSLCHPPPPPDTTVPVAERMAPAPPAIRLSAPAATTDEAAIADVFAAASAGLDAAGRDIPEAKYDHGSGFSPSSEVWAGVVALDALSATFRGASRSAEDFSADVTSERADGKSIVNERMNPISAIDGEALEGSGVETRSYALPYAVTPHAAEEEAVGRRPLRPVTYRSIAKEEANGLQSAPLASSSGDSSQSPVEEGARTDRTGLTLDSGSGTIRLPILSSGQPARRALVMFASLVNAPFLPLGKA